MSKNTAALAEQNAQNIKALADAIGMKKSQLHTGASRKEKAAAAQKTSLFGLSKDKDFEDDRSDKTVRDDLREQNAKNIIRIAKHLGVSQTKLTGEVTSTELERQKADIVVPEGDKQASDVEDLPVEEQKKAVLGLADEE